MRQLWGKTFEGDGTTKTYVFGFVNQAHSSPTQLFQDSVVRNDLTEIELRFGHFDGFRQPISSKVPAKWGGRRGWQLVEIKEIV
jgi:hypothetical protein